MGLVSVGLRTAQGLLHVAAGAGRLRALAPPTHGSGGPWWLPAGGQVWMNVISFFVTGKGDHDGLSWPTCCWCQLAYISCSGDAAQLILGRACTVTRLHCYSVSFPAIVGTQLGLLTMLIAIRSNGGLPVSHWMRLY